MPTVRNARTYSCAADDTESRRCEVGIGIGKLRMVQRVIKFDSKLKGTFLNGPVDRHILENCEIEVGLSGAVYDPGRAVPECCPDAICADDGRSCETGCIEIAVQFRLDCPSPDQLAFRACDRLVVPDLR